MCRMRTVIVSFQINSLLLLPRALSKTRANEHGLIERERGMEEGSAHARTEPETETETSTEKREKRRKIGGWKEGGRVGEGSSIDMYNNDVGKESAQKFMKQTGALKAATLYFASYAS